MQDGPLEAPCALATRTVMSARDFPEAAGDLQQPRRVNLFIVDLVGARRHVDCA
jgi:hypothetical protein